MTVRIPLSNPTVGELEREHVLAALDSGWVAPAGPQLEAFEAEVARHCGRRRAVGLSSGSAALQLALRVMGVGPGDVVICPTLTFIASAAAIIHCGATPLFVDCDETGNLSHELLEEALETSRAAGRPVRAVLPVDLYGKVADHPQLEEITLRHGALYVVDAAESLGARRDGRPAGSHGPVAALSFNGNKMVTASSGGAVVTDDDALADRVRHLSTQARIPAPGYVHEEIGMNARLSNILAALGLGQIQRLDEFVAARRAHRRSYRELAAQVEGISILGGDDQEDSCWMTSLLIDPHITGTTPDALRGELADAGIESRPVFAPMHSQPVFADAESYPRLLDGTADRLHREGLSVPSSPISPSEDIAEVCSRLAEAVSRARGRRP